jgi:hypothetical protein
MRREELESWLCDGVEREPTPTEMAILLGTESDFAAPTTRRTIRFVLAVLRDIYAEEAAVWRWLYRPRSDLADLRAIDLLRGNRTAQLESLVVSEWNAGVLNRNLASRDQETVLSR